MADEIEGVMKVDYSSANHTTTQNKPTLKSKRAIAVDFLDSDPEEETAFKNVGTFQDFDKAEISSADVQKRINDLENNEK